MPLPPVLSKLSLPIIGSPLFIVSNPKLVIEQCKAGIVGSMPALNARPAAQLEEWLAEITEALAAHDAAHPQHRIPRRTVTGAYLSGVGINAVVPARGGDVMKIYLVHRNVPFLLA